MLAENSIGYPFIELHTVDSTNNYAMGMVHEGLAQHGTAVFAHEQKKGKGQRNKQWLSVKNENIILSIIIKPFDLRISQSFLLSMAVAVGVRQFFSAYAGEETKIKWPNDLYWRDRKAGGILIENVIKGANWNYAIIGMGINLNQTHFDEAISKAVSLKQITGKIFDPVIMAKELIEKLKHSFNQLLTHPDLTVAAYHSHLFKHNELVRLKNKNRVFEAVIKGVTPEGFLIVEHEIEEQFPVGELSWIL